MAANAHCPSPWRHLSAPLRSGALCAALVLCAGGTARADYADGVAAANAVSMEAGVAEWRKAAWQADDFLSEMKLADIYDNSSDSKFYDPVEAYVWYYLATQSDSSHRDDVGDAAYDYLRDSRERARNGLARLIVDLDTRQREDARDRIVYILACRGAEGFIKLGHIEDTSRNYNEGYGGGGYGGNYGRGRRGAERTASPDMVGVNSSSVMVPNDAEALIYLHIAESMGNPVAHMELAALEARLRYSDIGRGMVAEQAARFHYWSPPFEFYPPGDNDSGVPYTDECRPTFQRERALALVGIGLPQLEMRHALAFLGWGHGDARGIQRFQLTIDDPDTGKLTAAEAVRLIQTAAVKGDAHSQNTLGVMYAKGIGVVRNYVRAGYWFERAADQRYGAALYHLGVLYKVGPEGIKQDLSRANDYFTAAALAGFRPSRDELSELLAHAEPPHGEH